MIKLKVVDRGEVTVSIRLGLVTVLKSGQATTSKTKITH